MCLIEWRLAQSGGRTGRWGRMPGTGGRGGGGGGVGRGGRGGGVAAVVGGGTDGLHLQEAMQANCNRYTCCRWCDVMTFNETELQCYEKLERVT